MLCLFYFYVYYIQNKFINIIIISICIAIFLLLELYTSDLPVQDMLSDSSENPFLH